MDRKTADFLETLEGLLITLEERAKAETMTLSEFREYITAMLEEHYKKRYED